MVSRVQEQFDRVKRYLARLENKRQQSLQEHEDDLYAFFQNCWHLKDWIKMRDYSQGNKKKHYRIERLVKKKDAIMHCADLANAAKHLHLDQTLRRDAAVSEDRNIVAFPDPEGSQLATYWVTSGPENARTRMSALDVARQAVQEWEDLIAAAGYLKGESATEGNTH